MAKPRVLFLCGQAPWLRNGGALLRNYWMIDALSKRYAVDLVVADEPGAIPADFAAIVDDYASFPRGTNSRGGFGRLARAVLPGESTLTAGWASPALREYVADRLGRFPYVAIQTDLPMRAALPRLDAIPIVYNAHNCESALLSRRALTESPPARVALMFDAMRVRSQERALIDRAALVATCAEGDLADFERFAPGIRSKAAIVANGVDIAHYAPLRSVQPDPCTVLITGSMDWRPNVLGLRWFLRTGLPRLRAIIPFVVVRVAGRMSPALEAELQRYPNVEAVANPASMDEHLAAADRRCGADRREQRNAAAHPRGMGCGTSGDHDDRRRVRSQLQSGARVDGPRRTAQFCRCARGAVVVGRCALYARGGGQPARCRVRLAIDRLGAASSVPAHRDRAGVAAGGDRQRRRRCRCLRSSLSPRKVSPKIHHCFQNRLRKSRAASSFS